MAAGNTKAGSDEGRGASHDGAPPPDQQVRALYEQAESQTATALEQLISKPNFGRLMAMSAENVAALSRVGSELADIVLRNLRLAGRADVVRLARQLHRTEDKLERLLQEVETLRDELARERDGRSGGAQRRSGGRTRSGNPGDREEAKTDGR